VLIDSTAPTNTTVAPSSAWRQGPVSVPVTFAADAGSPKHAEWRDGNSGPWTLSNSATIDGTGTHQLQTAAVDDAGNRTERTDVIKIDNTLPVDTTVSPAPGWHDAAVDVTVDGTDADSDVASVQWQLNSDPIVTGVTPGDSVRISQEGKNDFKTRVLDKAGNLSVWKHHAVWVDIAGPSDTTVVPSGWLTAASTVRQTSRPRPTGASITRLQWRLDGTTTGEVLNADTVPVNGQRRRRPQARGPGDRLPRPHPRLADAPRQARHLNPTDTTNVAAGWLPYDTLNVNGARHRRPTSDDRAGGVAASTAAYVRHGDRSASARRPGRQRRGSVHHASGPASFDNAGLGSGVEGPQTIHARFDATPRRQHSPRSAPRGLAQHADYSVVPDGRGRRCPAWIQDG
jgi:hypothetical protein